MTKKNRLIFVGAFDLDGDLASHASSAAGNQVQIEICENLKEEAEHHEMIFNALVFKPLKRWPYGPIYWSMICKGATIYFGYLNFPIIKQLIFSVKLFKFLLTLRPILVVKYNINFCEIASLFAYKKIRPAAYVVAIIQDINTESGRWFAFWRNKLVMRLANSLDLVIPVSSKIVEDFGFDKGRAMIFRGGLTRQSRALLAAHDNNVKPFAVFAGALEPYNGIDLLVEHWCLLQYPVDLHIFGKGSCVPKIKKFATHNPRIIFHGFLEEAEVTKWQSIAAINFCLRFSKNIEAGYFFPSKLFNIMCAPGNVFINKFDGLPSDILHGCVSIDDDLSNLGDAMQCALQAPDFEKKRSVRLQWISENANWAVITREIVTRAFYATPQ